MLRHCIVKNTGNVLDWLSYAGVALIKVADLAGSNVCWFRKVKDSSKISQYE